MSRYEAPIGRRGFAPLLAAVLIAGGCTGGAYAEASPGAAYVISDQEGYGLLECVTRNADCGKTVADSWCAAHGHGAARAFGRADDVTAAIDPKSAGASVAPDAAIVACLD